MGDLYLNIVESKNKETGGFDRQSVILFADDLPEFLKGFDESLKVLEKADREKKRGRKPQAIAAGGGQARGEGRPAGPGSFRPDRKEGRDRSREGRTGEEGRRKVVVKRGKPRRRTEP
jgi:hypothetical protein